MTMSTYKSLGGPPGGLIVTNDAGLAERLDAHRLPGPDRQLRRRQGGRAGRHAARLEGATAAPTRRRCATTAARAGRGARGAGPAGVRDARAAPPRRTSSRSSAARCGGGQTAAKRLRRANLLACGIGLPIAPVAGDMNGLRFGTPEIVRWGMTAADMPELAALIARGLLGNEAPEAVAAEVTAFRKRFDRLHFIR